MAESEACLRLVEPSFEPADPALQFLNRMKGALQSGHPAGQGGALLDQMFAIACLAPLVARRNELCRNSEHTSSGCRHWPSFSVWGRLMGM